MVPRAIGYYIMKRETSPAQTGGTEQLLNL